MPPEAVQTAQPETEAPRAEPKRKTKPKKQPPYHVVLLDDDDHTVEYVVRMMKRLFGHSQGKGLLIALEVDATGRAIVLTTTREHAELKRDQIHAFGADRLVAGCKGSMSALIQPAEEGQ